MVFPPWVWVGFTPLNEPLNEFVSSNIPAQLLYVSGQQSFYFYSFIAQCFPCDWKSGQTAVNRLKVRGAGERCSGKDIDVSEHQCLWAHVFSRCFWGWGIAKEPLIAQTEGCQCFLAMNAFLSQLSESSHLLEQRDGSFADGGIEVQENQRIHFVLFS